MKPKPPPVIASERISDLKLIGMTIEDAEEFLDLSQALEEQGYLLALDLAEAVGLPGIDAEKLVGIDYKKLDVGDTLEPLWAARDKALDKKIPKQQADTTYAVALDAVASCFVTYRKAALAPRAKGKDKAAAIRVLWALKKEQLRQENNAKGVQREPTDKEVDSAVSEASGSKCRQGRRVHNIAIRTIERARQRVKPR